MDSTTYNRTRQVISDVFNMTLDSINYDTSPENVMTWDSIQHLNLVIALEQEFEVKFMPTDFLKLTSVREIVEFLDNQ